ncbi:hypothetical protein EDD18DRAFT_1111546 [Armillaria luteobubalina]|uniref:BED-type domain-containing protein n=1 Tax=Armillaria luteobubalina TaxID=153913 RepID=A0AA39UJH8_9AGAR|nr:hypothetical protein EDD18DRAFT_1111546 [Armillaria luteobubalina]
MYVSSSIALGTRAKFSPTAIQGQEQPLSVHQQQQRSTPHADNHHAPVPIRHNNVPDLSSNNPVQAVCTCVHFDEDEDEYIDISGVPPETPPSTPTPPPPSHPRTTAPHATPSTPRSATPRQLSGIEHPASTPCQAYFGRHSIRQTVSKRGHRAEDIWTFFETKEDRRCCRFCLCQKEVGKSVPFHEYGGKGTDSLRSHLICHHGDEWITACDELKIKISAKNAREAVWAYREKNPGTGVSEDMSPTDSHNREFSRETFIDVIMMFVVGDDQVRFRFFSLNVIENRHFWDLILLLRHNFTDKDIPHIDNLHAHILELLDKHLEALSEEMKSSKGKISFTTDLWTNQNQ